MRKYKGLIFILIAVLLAATSLTGCGKKVADVQSIEIVSGSFQETYALDAGMDLSGALINVVYKGGNKESVPITADMVTGFDTYTTSNSRMLTVTYGGASSTFVYKVTWNGGAVDTPFRLNSSAESGEGNFVITVTSQNSARVENGVYAVKFYVSLSAALTFEEYESALPEGWTLMGEASGKNIKFIAYSDTGSLSLPDGQVIVKVRVTKGTIKGAVTLQNQSISDGTRDYTVPVTASQIIL